MSWNENGALSIAVFTLFYPLLKIGLDSPRDFEDNGLILSSYTLIDTPFPA